YTAFYLGSGGFRRPLARAQAAIEAAGSRLATGAWVAVVVVLVGAALVYLPAAVEARSNGFGNPVTLDGLAHYAQHQPDDFGGIGWLEQNAVDTPTVVEATGGSYTEFGEVAWMTGLPTILGWDFHEIQWRGESIIAEENARKHDIDTIYQTTDTKFAQDL